MSAAAFPHRLVVSVPGTGGEGGGGYNDQDEWVPAPPDADTVEGDVVFDTPAFVEDKGRGIGRDAAGIPATVSDAVAFCMKELPGDLPLGSTVTIFWKPGRTAGPTSDATVMRLSRTDNSLDLRNV